MAITLYLFLLSTSFFCWAAGYTVINNEEAPEFVSLRFHKTLPDGEGSCKVMIEKNGILREDLILGVRPLTIEQYRQTGRSFTQNVPHAESNDFNNTNLTVNFNKQAGYSETMNIEVSVVNDMVYEKNEAFLLLFDVMGSENINLAMAGLDSPNLIRCVIRNDDDVTVAFEKSSYTIPDGTNLMNGMYIWKNNTYTEEDIELTIIVKIVGDELRDELQKHYNNVHHNQMKLVFIFPAEQDRIGIPLMVPEGVTGYFTVQFRVTSSYDPAHFWIKNNLAEFFVRMPPPPPPPPTPTISSVPPLTPSSSPTAPSKSCNFCDLCQEMCEM